MSEQRVKKNYHSHTWRCAHARGSDAEFLKAGYEFGLSVYGVSDHVILPEGYSQPGMRGDHSLFDGYLSSIRSLQKEYEGRMEVLLGFECEYFDGRFNDYYRDLLRKEGMDYLILGEHCRVERHRFIPYVSLEREAAIEEYTDNVVAAMESGLFLYVAHPDFYMFFGEGTWDEASVKAAHRICQKAEETNTPLELNMGPSRRRKRGPGLEEELPYPYSKFWEIASSYQIRAILGIDAHFPEDYLLSDCPAFYHFAKRMGLTLIDDPFSKK